MLSTVAQRQFCDAPGQESQEHPKHCAQECSREPSKSSACCASAVSYTSVRRVVSGWCADIGGGRDANKLNWSCASTSRNGLGEPLRASTAGTTLGGAAWVDETRIDCASDHAKRNLVSAGISCDKTDLRRRSSHSSSFAARWCRVDI